MDYGRAVVSGRPDAIARGLLGALALQPALLENSDLRDGDFPAGPFRQVFQVIAEMWAETRPAAIDLAILLDRIGNNGNGAFIGSLFDEHVRLEPEVFGGRVAALRQASAEDRAKARLTGMLQKGFDPDLADEIIGECRRPRAERRLSDQGHTFAEIQKLEISVNWVVDRLIPERAITLLHAPGGSGKTWAALQLARALSTGSPFLGIQTQQRPVLYVDYEMPLALMRERAIGLGLQEGRLWHLSDNPSPPRLDSDGWDIFLQAAGTVVIIDSLRSAHTEPGNDDEVAAAVMDRLKRVRDHGATPILIHHTPKANERVSKGSTAWSDLSDHVLSLHRVRPQSFKPIDEPDEPDPDATYYFGTAEKSRYAPFRLYLRRGPGGELEPADDPDKANLDALGEYVAGEGLGKCQDDLIKWVSKELNVGRRQKARDLLIKGEAQGRWQSHKGFRGKKTYEPAG